MKIDHSGWDQPELTPARRRRGRPATGRSPDALVFKTVGLTADQWRWLESWSPGNVTSQVSELFQRAMKFWPSGPHKFR